MIKGQEIFKYIDPRAKYITKDARGLFYWFSVKPITVCGLWVSNGGGFNGSIGRIQIEEFEGKDWKECIIKKEQDPKEWIGSLCWFWCEYEDEEEDKQIDILKYLYINGNGDRIFISGDMGEYEYCRPVKKSEIKFFKEKSDE